jgi:hypothetical protein
MKGFRPNDRFDTSGRGGEPKKAVPTGLLVHSPTSVLMIARGWEETATGGGGEGREEQ